MTLSQEDQPGTRPTPADIACEHNIDCPSVPRVIDRDLRFCFLTKRRWKNLLIQTLKSTCSIQERYCQILFRKHYKLYSTVINRYFRWKNFLAHIAMWFMF